MKFEAGMKEQPDRFVATMRHVGPYNEIGKAWEKFMGWAGQKGLLQFPAPARLDPIPLQSLMRAQNPDVFLIMLAGKQVTAPVARLAIKGLAVSPARFREALIGIAGAVRIKVES